MSPTSPFGENRTHLPSYGEIAASQSHRIQNLETKCGTFWIHGSKHRCLVANFILDSVPTILFSRGNLAVVFFQGAGNMSPKQQFAMHTSTSSTLSLFLHMSYRIPLFPYLLFPLLVSISDGRSADDEFYRRGKVEEFTWEGEEDCR